MKMIARFILPHGDKHHAFEMVADPLPTKGEFIAAMRLSGVAKVRPILQGYSSNWAMVEFWTRDEAAAKVAAQTLANHFSVELIEGDFTRAELGLE